MEDKKLDFNQPLLSVRRFASTQASSELQDKRKTDKYVPSLPPIPYYKSELKSGPIRNPGTVPFKWEFSPGRPKYESKAQARPPAAPRLPPGWVVNAKQQLSDTCSVNESCSTSQITNVHSSLQNISSLHNNESLSEQMETGSSDSQEGDETYLDAVDTFSRSESFFLNCSISGVSGLDDPDVKPSGMFPIDPQAREFMMGRFLPAAKAVASESPQYAYRKQPVAREKEKQATWVVNTNKRPEFPRPRPMMIPHYAQDQGREESEDDISDDDASEHMPAKACGLLPRFCLKNSFFVVNPLPGLRVQPPVSSVRTIKSRPLYESSNGKGFHGNPRATKNVSSNGSITQGNSQRIFHELLASKAEDPAPTSPVVEKTLYIDSIHEVEPPKFNSKTAVTEGLTEVMGNDLETLIKSEVAEETRLKASSLKNMKSLDAVEKEAILERSHLENVDPSSLSSFEKSSRAVMNIKNNSGQDQQIIQESITLISSNTHEGWNADFSCQQPQKVDEAKESHSSYCQFPLNPPLPKSPSESWLVRTLPSMASKNPSYRIYPHKPTTQASTTIASVEPKWQTIVKSSNDRYEHFQFPKE